MLLNPNDYIYKYFHQPRGEDGFSGKIYLGTPKKEGLCPVLVKSTYYSDAINEYICCNIGQRIGVTTPRAWSFNPEGAPIRAKVNFQRAVGIEFLKDFDDSNIGGSFENEELARQTIKGKLFHCLMGDYDNHSLALCNGKVYAYDFADSMYSKYVGIDFADTDPTIRDDHGLSAYDHYIIGHESSVINEIREFLIKLCTGFPSQYYSLWQSVFTELREKMIEEYEKDGFEGLISDVRCVFSEKAAMYVRDLIKSSLEASNEMLTALMGIYGEYFRMDDGVLLMIDKKHAGDYKMVD